MIIAIQTLVYFRESLFRVIQKLFSPYFESLLSLRGASDSSDDEDSEEQAFAEYDDEKGVIFFPPVYVQRYAAVVDCLMDDRWCGRLEKIVDLGCHDISFIKYLKDIPGINSILGVDIDSNQLYCSSELLGVDDPTSKIDSQLQVTLFQGNAADPDYRLIGCDAVISIEMIEHMLPHDLERLVHTVFGFIKPRIALFTTPNGDFNVLFLSLESNGLRRLDHFFEWSQEQFHDWCSNIVTRYPQYAVSCKGIGPGPEGTEHLGCCSQLALFVAKDYRKQQDLNLNSLAVVPDAPDSEIGLNNQDSSMDNNVHGRNCDSMTELSYSNKQSCVTLFLSSPSYYTFESINYADKTSQCNIDIEIARSFLMFQEEDFCLNVLKPRRTLDNKIYYIEDVTCRLNCSTCQVRKFSKKSSDLMAKNKIDLIAHTQDVVDEIKHLTKILNFNKSGSNSERTTIWNNINWGDNAPYWNQYYKIIKQFKYPFETKSDDHVILDLISDEIHRIIDCHGYNEYVLNEKIIIPIEQIMTVVEHLTHDINKVRDLLEWNGHEIVGDSVVHTRVSTDDSANDDWEENDYISDVKRALYAKEH